MWKTRVRKGSPSDPFLLTGFGRKMLHISTDRAADILIEIDFLETARAPLRHPSRAREVMRSTSSLMASRPLVRLVRSRIASHGSFLFT